MLHTPMSIYIMKRQPLLAKPFSEPQRLPCFFLHVRSDCRVKPSNRSNSPVRILAELVQHRTRRIPSFQPLQQRRWILYLHYKLKLKIRWSSINKLKSIRSSKPSSRASSAQNAWRFRMRPRPRVALLLTAIIHLAAHLLTRRIPGLRLPHLAARLSISNLSQPLLRH